MDRLVNRVKENTVYVNLIKFFNQSITVIVYLLYPSILIKLVLDKDQFAWILFLLPMISFVLLSVFRSWYDAPRPYEVYDYEPILSKETKGNSFPSRHVFSIFVISTGITVLHSYLGSVLLILGFILAMCRYLGGVHFLKDVLVGAFSGILPWLIVWAIGLI